MVVLHPAGTYWYLHTLVICLCVQFAVFRVHVMDDISKIIISSLLLFFLGYYTGLVVWKNVMYFCIGALSHYIFKGINVSGLTAFSAFVAVVVICIWGDSPMRENINGVGLTCLVALFLCCESLYCSSWNKTIIYLGRNSLAIVLFSPFFTILTKLYAEYFIGEVMTYVWAVLSTLVVVGLCIFSAQLFDKMGMSKLISGRCLLK